MSLVQSTYFCHLITKIVGLRAENVGLYVFLPHVYIHLFCRYALPTEFLTVRHLGDEFTTTASDMQVDAELPVHLRVVQVLSLLAVTAPILLQFLSTEVPPGVKLSVHEVITFFVLQLQ